MRSGLSRYGRRWRAWILACAGLLLFSCRPPHTEPGHLPIDLLLQEMDEAAARLRDLRGSARIETSFEGRRGRASLRIRYLSPAQFRIDVHGPLFQVPAVLLVHDRLVRLYLPRENTVFEGMPGTRDTPIPGLDLTLEDVRSAITGAVEPGRYAGMRIVDFRYDGETATVTLQDGGDNLSLQIDTEKKTVIREARESPARRVSVVRTFGRFRKVNGIWRPGTIRMTRNGEMSGTMELTYRTQSVNRGLRPADIEVRLPATVIRRSLEEAAPVFETMDEASASDTPREGFPPEQLVVYGGGSRVGDPSRSLARRGPYLRQIP